MEARVKYNDYPDKYPEQIIEKLNLAYKNVNTEGVNDDFFKVEGLSLVNNKVEISAESKCELESHLINLLEGLNRCEGYLLEIKQFDKSNKKVISNYIDKTKNNKIEIYNCCYNKQDISCDYYATHSPSFNACCANYCACELDVLEQLLGLCACECFPINRRVLFNILQCRFACLKGIICKYSGEQ